MNMLTIEVWDATGNKKQLVELPPDAPVNRVIAVLVDKMSLPRYSPDGQLMSYKFHHKASGRQLLDDQTLASADIHSGDVLRLQPEITAGYVRPGRRSPSPGPDHPVGGGPLQAEPPCLVPCRGSDARWTRISATTRATSRACDLVMIRPGSGSPARAAAVPR